MRRLSNQLRLVLGEAAQYIDPTAERLQVTTRSLRAVRLYFEGQVAAARGNWAEAEALFRAALAEDANFASAHIWMAWALHNQGREPDAFLTEARRAVDLAGNTTERERPFILGSYHFIANDLERAVGEFEVLVRRYPDDAWGIRKLSPGTRPARACDAGIPAHGAESSAHHAG